MNKEQIPVVVDGKTYYGCCEMCKKALASDASKRAAVDPVSGKKVDKAAAVIGADADGNVKYFESEKNLQKYNQ
jgi:YHS domain-containing protein